MFAYQSVPVCASRHHIGGCDHTEREQGNPGLSMHQQGVGQVKAQSMLVIVCALVFGGVSKLAPFVPVAAFATTVLFLSWSLGEGAAAEEPDWVQRLSLASTGLLYLGLGYCLGAVVFVLLPLVAALMRKMKAS